jgi:hypothetical protein
VLSELAREAYAAGNEAKARAWAEEAGEAYRETALTPWQRRPMAIALFAVEEYNVLRAWAEGQSWQQAPDLPSLGNDLEGVEVEITTEVETYEGNDYEKVRFVNKPGHFANRGVKAMDANQARAVVAKYNALLRNSPKPAATAQKPAQKAGRVDPAQYASPDEDLPF